MKKRILMFLLLLTAFVVVNVNADVFNGEWRYFINPSGA